MSSGQQSVRSLLYSIDGEFGAILRHSGYLAKVRGVVLDVLPGSAAAHVHVASVANGRLLLHVDSAGWATRLRYAEPSIQRALAQRLRLHTDKVVVRTRPDLAQSAPQRTERRISAANREHIRRVAEYIDHPALAQTLQRLARHDTPEDTSHAATTGRALT